MLTPSVRLINQHYKYIIDNAISNILDFLIREISNKKQLITKLYHEEFLDSGRELIIKENVDHNWTNQHWNTDSSARFDTFDNIYSK